MNRGEPPRTNRPPTFSGFALRLALYLFAVSLLFSLGGLHQRLAPLQKVIASAVSAGANLAGAQSQVDADVVRLDQAALEINHECTAVFVLLVYAVFVIAYPAPWMRRLSGILVGAVVLMAVNVTRLIALAVIASRHPDMFAYFHEYFFQGVFIALLAVLASIWTEQVRRAAASRVSG